MKKRLARLAKSIMYALSITAGITTGDMLTHNFMGIGYTIGVFLLSLAALIIITPLRGNHVPTVPGRR